MTAPAPSPDVVARYALLRLEHTTVLLPQSDLATLEPVADVDLADADGAALGSLTFMHEKLPVFCPTDALEASPRLAPGRRICAVLSGRRKKFGLVCQEVASVETASVVMFDLPDCMRTPNTPIRALAVYDGGVVSVTTAADLYTLMVIAGAGSNPQQGEAFQTSPEAVVPAAAH